MKNNYAGKHVLITGGSSGIGLAAAKLAAQHGANVTILSRRKDTLEQAARDIIGQRSQDTFVKTISADVSNEAEVSQALKDLVAGQGLPDVVINCAGVTHPGEFYLLDSEIFRWNMNINYFGAVYVLKALVPDMMQRGSGMIIFVSSAVGLFNIYGYSAYGASKYAVSGLAEALRMELKPHGIQVSLVIPADTRTPQLEYEDQYKPAVTREINKVGGLMEPEDVAREMLSGAARGKYLILPGSTTKFLYIALRIAGRGLFYSYFDGLVRKTLQRLPPAKNDLSTQHEGDPD
jgi:short-subunit dehydrogenase